MLAPILSVCHLGDQDHPHNVHNFLNHTDAAVSNTGSRRPVEECSTLGTAMPRSASLSHCLRGLCIIAGMPDDLHWAACDLCCRARVSLLSCNGVIRN